MEKTICITPVDKTMRSWTIAVKLLNDFKARGYTKREVFVDVVAKHNKKYRDNFRNIQKLHYFWAMRERNPEVLIDLENVFKNLKPKE